jgi:hypothetical protein
MDRRVADGWAADDDDAARRGQPSGARQTQLRHDTDDHVVGDELRDACAGQRCPATAVGHRGVTAQWSAPLDCGSVRVAGRSDSRKRQFGLQINFQKIKLTTT